jgi:hypothetical protein
MKCRGNRCELLDTTLASRNTHICILNREAKGVHNTVVLAGSEEVGSVGSFTLTPTAKNRLKLSVDVFPFEPHIYLWAEFYSAIKEGVAVIFRTSLMFNVL